MRYIGFILIALGIVLLVNRSCNYTTSKEVVDAGPVEIKVREKKSLSWPWYAGGIAIVAGVVLVLAERRRT